MDYKLHDLLLHLINNHITIVDLVVDLVEIQLIKKKLKAVKVESWVLKGARANWMIHKVDQQFHYAQKQYPVIIPKLVWMIEN